METRNASVSGGLFSFLLHHTTRVPAHELTDSECCICLDPFTVEYPLRITGISGCSHVFGSNCIKSIISHRPGTAKTCPLCRSVWIPPENENELSAGMREYITFNPQSSLVPGQRLANGNGFSPILLPPPPARQEPGLALRNAPRSASPIAISLGREGEGSQELTAETFASYRREIEDIRERAAARRLSRPRASGFLSRIRATDSEQAISEDTASDLLSEQPFSSLTVSVGRRVGVGSSDEDEEANRENRFLEQASGGLPTTYNARTRINRAHGFHMRNTVQPGSIPHSTASDRSSTDPSTLPAHLQGVREGVSHLPATNSLREESNNIKELLLDFRERDLAERERKVDEEVKRVEEREINMTQQENALSQRELQLNDRESKVNEFVEGMRRQLGDFDRLRAELGLN